MKRIASGLIILVVALAAAAFGYRAWRQHENAQALALTGPNAVEWTGFVPLGGIDQWVTIRGEDKANPVLLFLHGGPGSSETPVAPLFRAWEKRFTVVMWDQRCAGKTFARNGADSCKGMTVESVAGEGIALADYLRHRLHKDKVVALGHSWGTMIGARMVKERPDLFSAFVATGLVVSIPEKEPVIYARALARLRAAHAEEGVRALEKIHPPYKTHQEIETERDWSDRYDIPPERDLRDHLTTMVLFAPDWSAWDLYGFLQAPKYAEAQTFDADADYDVRKLGPKYEVPFIVINGEDDNITPTDLARRYFDTVQAPRKAFVVIPGAGHSAVLTKPDAFLDALECRVLSAISR